MIGWPAARLSPAAHPALNGNVVTVQVPIGVAANIAANVCVGDLEVGVLASQLSRGQTVECLAENGDALVAQRVRNTP